MNIVVCIFVYHVNFILMKHMVNFLNFIRKKLVDGVSYNLLKCFRCKLQITLV